MASKTALVGALGLGKQSAKGSVAGTFSYIPATSINLNTAQQTQTLPPEIGGSYFLRGSFKSGVAVSGDVGMVVRPNSLGYLLDMLCGSHTDGADNAVVADPLTPPVLSDTAGSSTWASAGLYQVAYSFSNGAGETEISPTAGIILANATDKIHVAAIALPAGATGINFYTSAAAGSETLLKNAVTGTGAAVDLIAPSAGSAPPTSNTTGTVDGSYSHIFNPFAPGAGSDLPWYSAIKDVAKLYYEQYVDMKLNSLRLDISKQQIITAQAGFFGLTPTEITAPSETLPDASEYFTAATAQILFEDETGGLSFPAAAVQFDRASLDFGNNLSQDEYVVGSYTPVDSTLLQRTATVSFDVTLRDPALIRAVYRAGGTSAWSPKIVRAHANIVLQSADNMPGAAKPYALMIDFPGLDMLMMPVPMQGAQLIRANLSTQVTLGPSGQDQFSFRLLNTAASY